MKSKEIVEEYYRKVYNISLKYLGNKASAELVVKEVIFQYIINIEKNNSLNTKKEKEIWIMRKTMEECLKVFEKNKDNPDYQKELVLQGNRLFDEVQRLDHESKAIFVLHYLEKIKINEIEEILNIDENVIKSKIEESRKKMSMALKIKLDEKK